MSAVTCVKIRERGSSTYGNESPGSFPLGSFTFKSKLTGQSVGTNKETPAKRGDVAATG